jgi:hypothetical protein
MVISWSKSTGKMLRSGAVDQVEFIGRVSAVLTPRSRLVPWRDARVLGAKSEEVDTGSSKILRQEQRDGEHDPMQSDRIML